MIAIHLPDLAGLPAPFLSCHTTSNDLPETTAYHTSQPEKRATGKTRPYFPLFLVPALQVTRVLRPESVDNRRVQQASACSSVPLVL
jgi:hypothetical protein